MNQKSLNPSAGDAGAQGNSLQERQPNFPTKFSEELPARRFEEVGAVIELLQERWPKCFSVYEKHRRPLKIGIHLDILKAIDGAITADELSNALRCYVANEKYLKSMKAGAARVALDDSPAGIVTKEHAEEAKRYFKIVRSARSQREMLAWEAKAQAGRRVDW